MKEEFHCFLYRISMLGRFFEELGSFCARRVPYRCWLG